jgi:PAS domain-containing protein
MKSVCAWCSKDMDAGPAKGPVSHGICLDCGDKLFSKIGMDLRLFLDKMEVPILLLGGDQRVRAANRRAREILGSDIPTVDGRQYGEVFECIYASLKGGCGMDVHCSGCAIRITVLDTFRTGKSHLKVPAFIHRGIPENLRRADMLISTEKVKDWVLLRIDDRRDA